MTKAESEKAIRYLTHEWAKTQEQPENWHPSFIDFIKWLEENNYAHFLNFRSRFPSRDIAEMWFDQELKQTWRN